MKVIYAENSLDLSEEPSQEPKVSACLGFEVQWVWCAFTRRSGTSILKYLGDIFAQELDTPSSTTVALALSYAVLPKCGSKAQPDTAACRQSRR